MDSTLNIHKLNYYGFIAYLVVNQRVLPNNKYKNCVLKYQIHLLKSLIKK